MRIPDEDVVVVTVSVAPPTASWDEEAQASDAVASVLDLDENAEVGDMLDSVLVLGEDVHLDDSWATTTTGEWVEDAQTSDELTAAPNFDDAVNVADVLDLVTARLGEPTNVNDLLDLLRITGLKEPGNVNDRTRAAVTSATAARSAAPASDFLQDTYVQEGEANTNFGNAEELTIQDAVLNARHALIEVDFTRLASVSGYDGGGGNAYVLQLTFSGVGLTAYNLQISAGTQAGKPFVEDTVTWNTRPTRLTNLKNREVHNLSAGAGDKTVNLSFTVAQVSNNIVGNWLLIYIEPETANLDDIFLASRENATTSRRPIHSRVNLQRGT